MPWTAVLVVTTGRTRGGAELTDEYVFTERSRCVIGRGRDAHIRIAAEQHKVSRRHCLVEFRPPHARVRDLGSHNGTYVNGERVEEAAGALALADGDELRIGGTTVRVVLRPDAHDDPLPGVRVLRELGRGGQGVVELARHALSGRLVAVKSLTPQGHVDPAAREAFRREMDCLKALRHPHIVRFHDSAVYDGRFWLLCEVCAGGSVADLVRRRGGRLPAEVAVPLALQALDGLAYAHQAEVTVRLADGGTAAGRGLVHRDIKPQNLLLGGTDRQPVLKLGDFGLAKAFDQAGLSGRTHTGAVGGSVAFMPRRQLIDYKYARPDVDLWATTACLYWMLTGRPPRDFPPDADPVAVVLREPPVPVRTRLSSLPRRLAELIDTTLDEAAGAAPSSAPELASALRRTL